MNIGDKVQINTDTSMIWRFCQMIVVNREKN